MVRPASHRVPRVLRSDISAMKAAGFCLLISAVCAASPAVGGSLAPRAVPIDQFALFRIVGNFYNVDPDLLAAIAAIESGGDSRALSPAGAEGLMQLMPETAQRFRVTDPFDPVDNALGAARFIDYLRRRPDFRMSLPELLAAYNAGEGAVAKYDGVPPYAETREYVRRVIAAYLLEALIPRKAPSTSYRRPVASTLCTSGGPLTAVTAAAGQRAVAPGGRQVRPTGDRQPRDVFAQLAEI